MDWQMIAAPLIRAGLPILGNVFLPGIGGQLGGAIGNAIAGAMGVEPTPEAVKTAIEAEPDLARARLADLESERRADIDRMRIEAENTASARQMQTVAIQAGSPLAWVPVAVTVAIFFYLVGVMVSVSLGVIREDGIGLNSATNFWMAAVGYWLGSSMGSKVKTETIAGIAVQSNAPSPAQLVGRVVNDAIADKRR